MAFIDAHVHVWSDDTAHYPLAAGWKKEDMQPPSLHAGGPLQARQTGRR